MVPGPVHRVKKNIALGSLNSQKKFSGLLLFFVRDDLMNCFFFWKPKLLSSLKSKLPALTEMLLTWQGKPLWCIPEIWMWILPGRGYVKSHNKVTELRLFNKEHSILEAPWCLANVYHKLWTSTHCSTNCMIAVVFGKIETELRHCKNPHAASIIKPFILFLEDLATIKIQVFPVFLGNVNDCCEPDPSSVRCKFLHLSGH